MLKIRSLIIATAPKAEEAMSYGVPAFKLDGRLFVAYACFKEHLGLYPEPQTIEAFKEELTDYKTSKGAIQFRFDQPVPYGLIEKMLSFKYKKIA